MNIDDVDPEDGEKRDAAEDSDDSVETTEAEPMTGSAVPTGSPATSGAVAAAKVYSSGGMVSGTFGGTSGSGGWITPTTTTTTFGYPPEAKRVARKSVKLPTKVTKKVLIAFIDEADEDNEEKIVWAAHLPLEDFKVKTDGVYGELRLTLGLEDIYGTED